MTRHHDDELQAYLDADPALDPAAAQRWHAVETGEIADPAARAELAAYREIYAALSTSDFEFAPGLADRALARRAMPMAGRSPWVEGGLFGCVLLLTLMVLVNFGETLASSWLGDVAPWLALAGMLAALSELADMFLLRRRTPHSSFG